jgi:hypothetical protein
MSGPPPPACDAFDCYATSTVETFTVGRRPPGLEGLEGWPDGAPDLTDTHIPTGRTLRFCRRHAVQLREAAQRQEDTVYGIRPHKLMSDAEHDAARRIAEQTPQLTREAAAELLRPPTEGPQ